MKVALLLPRLPLPFHASDSRWFHVLASQWPRLGVSLTVVAIHEGDSGHVEAAWAHAEQWGYELRVVQPSVPSNALARADRLWRPRTELLQASAVRGAIERLRHEESVVVTSGMTTPGLTSALDRVSTEIHYLASVDRAGEHRRGAREVLNGIQERRAETRLVTETRTLIVNSARMAELVAKRRPASAVTRLTIDPRLYPFHGGNADPIVGFIGSMFWAPSRRAAERLLLRVWPKIKVQWPQARLLIAGWQAQERLGKYFPVDGVELVPSVRDPAQFFHRLALLLFPSAGGTGIKIKTLEAMAYGVPVVTTAEGVEGLEDVKGAPDPVEDDDEALAAAATALLDDHMLRRHLADEGRAAFESDLQPRRVAGEFLSAALRGLV